MKIYFTASISGKEKFGKEYELIVKTLQALDCQVYADHILKTDPRKLAKEDHAETIRVYKKLSKMLKDSNIIVAEISYPSVSVGHEVSLALESNKSVIALHVKGKTSALLEGSPNKSLQIICYEEKNLASLLKRAIKKALEQADVRFNFFVTPRHLSYLDWIAKNQRVPRSVYLRRLIEAEMKKNRRYQEEQ